MSIDITQVELCRANATAISYTWGEFDRKPRAVGHLADNPDATVSLTLGSEWKIEDLVGRLSELGSAKPLWIDQLCIPQEDEDETRNALASVPSIYRSFDVVALMPGHPCKCIDEFLEKTNAMPAVDTLSPSNLSAVGSTLAPAWQVMADCLNAACDATWFTRIWTRQELLYSREIRVVWTSDKQIPCVRFDASHPENTTNIHDLAPFAAGLRESLIDQGYSEKAVLFHIYQRSSRLDHTAYNDLQYYTQNETRKTYRDEQLLRRFLKGENFSSALPYSQHDTMVLHDSTPNNDTMKAFLGGLGRLSRTSPRVATKAHDYVLSIWIDCPGYTIPREYKEKGIPALVKDGLNQLQNNCGKALVTHAPRGLFHHRTGSGLWAAIRYLKQADLNNVTNIYRPIPLADAVLVPVSKSGAIPIRLTNAEHPSLAVMAIPFEILLSKSTIPELFKTLAQAAPTWSITVIMQAAAVINAESGNFKGGGVSNDTEWQQLRPLVLGSLFASMIGSHEISPATGLSPNIIKQGENLLMSLRSKWEPHHVEMAYVILAAALGLDENVCMKEGLQIIAAKTAAPDEVVRIGFCRKGITQEHIKKMAEKGRLLTVRMAPDRDDEGLSLNENLDGSVLYEVERVDEQVDGKPGFRVFAVWIPTIRTPSSHIGAVVDMAAGARDDWMSVDAFIV